MSLALLWNFYLLLLNSLSIISGEIFMAVQREEQKRSNTQKNMASLSPTDEELEDGSNWELVSTQGAKEKQYIEHKAIPIARVISRG